MDFLRVVNNLKERKNALESQIKLHSGLVSHNYIVEVGAYTVTTIDGKAKLQDKVGSKLPSQWTSEGVKEIKEKCNWTNMLGDKMEIKAISYRDWYAEELKGVIETLETFEPIVEAYSRQK